MDSGTGTGIQELLKPQFSCRIVTTGLLHTVYARASVLLYYTIVYSCGKYPDVHLSL